MSLVERGERDRGVVRIVSRAARRRGAARPGPDLRAGRGVSRRVSADKPRTRRLSRARPGLGSGPRGVGHATGAVARQGTQPRVGPARENARNAGDVSASLPHHACHSLPTWTEVQRADHSTWYPRGLREGRREGDPASHPAARRGLVDALRSGARSLELGARARRSAELARDALPARGIARCGRVDGGGARGLGAGAGG